MQMTVLRCYFLRFQTKVNARGIAKNSEKHLYSGVKLYEIISERL